MLVLVATELDVEFGPPFRTRGNPKRSISFKYGSILSADEVTFDMISDIVYLFVAIPAIKETWDAVGEVRIGALQVKSIHASPS